jgi:hypothetical protein
LSKRFFISQFITLAAVLLFGWALFTTHQAHADLGNTGIPVRCKVTLSPFVAATNAPFSCFVADGTSFSAVPASHYLLVTDVEMSRYNSDAGQMWAGVRVFKDNCTGSYVDELGYRGEGFTNYSSHYVTPYLVLAAGDCLAGYRYGPVGNDFKVSGLLTTSVSYLPMLSRN